MSELLDFEKDQFLELLTEALRAGPRSPQWQQAVERLRELNPAEADEYQLLIRAREDLEHGRDYRSIRPGPEFTHKVMTRIEAEGASAGKPAVPAASVIAILAAAAIIAVLIIIAVVLTRQPPVDADLTQLQNTMFTTTAFSADFSTAIPGDFTPFGTTPDVSSDGSGLRPADPNGAKDFVGGGVYLASAINASDPFAMEVGVNMSKPTPRVDLQIFITESPRFDGPRTVSAKEFVVDLREGKFGVYRPDGTLAGSLATATVGRNMVTIKVQKKFVVVEANGQTLYAGRHGLSADAPRWLGVRFLARGSSKETADLSVPMIRVVRP